jgi:mannosyltransferase OCH1-like enzyme
MIPKIIHQIWEGYEYPLHDFNKQLGKTWKECHPDWRYEFWDGDRMNSFVEENYPEILDIYNNYKYGVQRWDAIRYLILYKMGGLYADFDYECLESFDDYIKGEKKCYFAMEPEEHRLVSRKDIYFNNALMITPPEHPFFEYIITYLQTKPVVYTGNKSYDVLSSTGPLMLSNLYENYEDKSNVVFFTL